MTSMTTKERFTRMYQHREADRVPMFDSPWEQTIIRWKDEGMPDDDWTSFFGLDQIGQISADYSPQYIESVVEETDDYIIRTTSWGATYKKWKRIESTPEFLDFSVKDQQTWEEAKARMVPSHDRVDWASLKRDYPKWQKEGRWIQAYAWFGFDVAHSWMVGTERLLMAMLEEPEWCFDIFNTYLDMSLAIMDMIWDAGYTFDELHWPDDMGYKGTQFFSADVYRQLLKPVQKRAIDWAHSKGIVARLHSCGNISKLIPDFIDIGMDGLNPLEVKAGVEPLEIKKQYGDKLVLHGGINAVLWDNVDAITRDIRSLVPELKKGGGYIFASDHSIPNTVSLENMKAIVDVYKECGAY